VAAGCWGSRLFRSRTPLQALLQSSNRSSSIPAKEEWKQKQQKQYRQQKPENHAATPIKDDAAQVDMAEAAQQNSCQYGCTAGAFCPEFETVQRLPMGKTCANHRPMAMLKQVCQAGMDLK